MIQVSNCKDMDNDIDRVLVGSSSFEEAERGRYNQVRGVYRNRNSLFAVLEVKEGYYYLGVKNNKYDPEERYAVPYS